MRAARAQEAGAVRIQFGDKRRIGAVEGAAQYAGGLVGAAGDRKTVVVRGAVDIGIAGRVDGDSRDEIRDILRAAIGDTEPADIGCVDRGRRRRATGRDRRELDEETAVRQ